MKIYKNILHIWIALASVLAFALGWIGLAHSPKPVQAKSSSTTTTTITTQLQPLPPMPSLSQVQQNSVPQVQDFSSVQTQTFSRPTFRSSGS
jgi:hypothetical protein